MKKYILLLVFLFSGVYLGFSQKSIHYVGISLGGTDYIGDVGSSQLEFPNSGSLGLIYKIYNRKRRSFRFGLDILNINGNDATSGDIAKEQRKYSFNSQIYEGFAGLEFNFRDYKPYLREPQIMPYIGVGVGLTAYFSHFYNSLGEPVVDGFNLTPVLPVIIGVKLNLTGRLMIASEIGVRYTFTDNLDGSAPQNSRFANFGNDMNDWYTYFNISLVYAINRIKCFICKD